jgi:hypothetical protein
MQNKAVEFVLPLIIGTFISYYNPDRILQMIMENRFEEYCSKSLYLLKFC